MDGVRIALNNKGLTLEQERMTVQDGVQFMNRMQGKMSREL